jgi:hypothetical protein
MTIIERVARALAGQHYSRNAEGAAPPGVPAAELVDRHWRDYVNDAVAVLKTMREPDPRMIAAGEAAISRGVAATWEEMVRAAVGEDVPSS